MVACEYLFTHMHYPSTISGTVGKTICPYTMCLHHQVSAWDVCSLTCRVTVSLHFTVDSSFYMNSLCWCYHVAANVHPCLHISSVLMIWWLGHVCSHMNHVPVQSCSGTGTYAYTHTMCDSIGICDHTHTMSLLYHVLACVKLSYTVP